MFSYGTKRQERFVDIDPRDVYWRNVQIISLVLDITRTQKARFRNGLVGFPKLLLFNPLRISLDITALEVK
jgi:hypothetical protein